MSEHVASGRGKTAAAVGGALCALLFLTTACSSGLRVPQVNLGSLAHSRATRAARQQVTARIAVAIAALKAAHLSVTADAVEDNCSRWENLQGNGAITQWGVVCAREEDVFGGFSHDPAAQLTAIQRALERHGWDGWAKLGTTAQCGNYSRGHTSAMQGDFALAKMPLATAPANKIRADVSVGPASGQAAHGNIDYVLGCAECGPSAVSGSNYLGGIPPFYYVQHTCPESSAIESAIARRAGMWHVEFFDSGYVYAAR